MSTESNAGRPSKYKPEFPEMLLEYFGKAPYTKEGQDLVANDFPSLAGFAIKLGVHRDTLHEWSTIHPEFSDAYKRAKDFQENFVIVNGNKGLINPAFGIFTAKNVLGWRDKQKDESDVVVNNFGNMSDQELDERLEKLKAEKK